MVWWPLRNRNRTSTQRSHRQPSRLRAAERHLSKQPLLQRRYCHSRVQAEPRRHHHSSNRPRPRGRCLSRKIIEVYREDRTFQLIVIRKKPFPSVIPENLCDSTDNPLESS